MKERVKYPQADLLTSIPGISTYSELLILAEIGDFSRFPTADKLSQKAPKESNETT